MAGGSCSKVQRGYGAAAQQQMEQSLQNIQQSMSHASATYAQAEADAQHLFAN